MTVRCNSSLALGIAIIVTCLAPVGIRVCHLCLDLCHNHLGPHNASSSEGQGDTALPPLLGSSGVAAGLGHRTLEVQGRRAIFCTRGTGCLTHQGRGLWALVPPAALAPHPRGSSGARGSWRVWQ